MTLVVMTTVALMATEGLASRACAAQAPLRVLLHAHQDQFPSVRATAIAIATFVWQREGVEIEWLDPATPVHISEAPQILSVSIAHFGRPIARADRTLGTLDWLDGRGPGRIIRVSLDAISAWLDEHDDAGPEMHEQVAGFVLAHEMGHYLLRQPRHSPAGLMKPYFTLDDVRAGANALTLDAKSRAFAKNRLRPSCVKSS